MVDACVAVAAGGLGGGDWGEGLAAWDEACCWLELEGATAAGVGWL